jgi:hypothetical protein
MIELQHDWVGRATVNTGMSSQKFQNTFLITLSLDGVLLLTPQYVLRSVSGVMTTEVFPTASAAKVM